MKPNIQQSKQTGSVYIQFLEKRSIPLYKEDERDLISLPINIDRACFKKEKREKDDIKLAKKSWKSTLPPNYKPVLLLRA